jgi:hypothetical protein
MDTFAPVRPNVRFGNCELFVSVPNAGAAALIAADFKNVRRDVLIRLLDP